MSRDTTIDGEMSLEQAHDALRSQQIGRLAWVRDGRPEVLPVTFALLDGAVVLRSGLGGKERAAGEHTDAAFEVDGVDTTEGIAWSVVVHGRLEDVSNGDEIEALERRLPPPHVTGAERNHVLRLDPRAVRGRRLTLDAAYREEA